jgi:F-type H+-transporting ATPase subunit b
VKLNAKYKISTFLFLIFSAFNALANEHESHHEVSVLDLKYPVLNFVLLFGFIIWKGKAPLSAMFDKNSDSVKSQMDSAEKQSKDANEKLNSLENKMKNIDTELVKITGDYNEDVAVFTKTTGEETNTTLARMKRDVENKIDGEKKELADQLNHDLLNLVVGKAQGKIGANRDLKTQATSKIVAGMK